MLFGLLDAAKQADAGWASQRRPGDTNGWQWERVLREVGDCVYQLGSPTVPIAALFAMPAKVLSLPRGPTVRLNFFQVAPPLRGSGFARLAFAIAGRFALAAGGRELAVCSMPAPKLVGWYEDLGGTAEPPPGWRAPNGAVAIWFDAAKLKTLGEYADAVQEKAQP